MMKPWIECLHDEEVGRLLTGELNPDRTAEMEQHVATCYACRQRLEQQVGDDNWWNETESSLRGKHATVNIRESLQDAEGERAFAARIEETRRSGTRIREGVLDLLGPTDDPNMLGRIGPYEIVGLLGQGGMGAVFKGYDRSLNRFVAIKMLLPHLAVSGAARKRFAREAQAVAAVVDDHVMAIHCVDEWRGVPYLVMNYSRGDSLQKRLSDNGPLEVREILRIGMQAAKGLAAAHAQGIVHRDIKPANIFLDQSVERVQLMDFGLARAVDDASLTRTGVLAGTPQYMSPEQARAEAVDHRSDLFSLGSVMYAMCTGYSPFRAESSFSVLRLITDKEPRPIREINSDVPEWLCSVINKLMAKQSSNRFSSALEVASLLEECLAHVQRPTSIPLPVKAKSLTVSSLSALFRTFIGVLLISTILYLVAAAFMQVVEPPQVDKPKQRTRQQNSNIPSGTPVPTIEKIDHPAQWSEIDSGMRISLRVQKEMRVNGERVVVEPVGPAVFEYGQTLHLMIQLENADIKPLPFGDLIPTYKIQVLGDSGEWSDSPLHAISVAPWEASREVLKPHFSYGWPLQFEHFRFVETPVDDLIELRIGVARKPSDTEKDPHWVYSRSVIIELEDKPLTVGTNRPSDTAAVVTDIWDTRSQEMDVVFREFNAGKGNHRAMHINGAGKVTLINCGKPGRTSAQLSQERLDKLASQLKACQFWKVSKEAEQPRLDSPYFQFQVAYGANNFVGQFDSTATWEGVDRYKELQAILSRVMDEAIVHAKDDKVLPW